MRYLSICSGIEAASVAFQPYGWEPVALSEIDKNASALLAHHYPSVPNWGDMSKFEEWPDAAIELLCGGTPCQAFSVAGLRKGLADPRGNLMLTFGAIAGRYRPRWVVWENVPGVLSSNGGRDFGAFLGMLGQLGYGVAYRVLDAQYVRTRRFPRAVPQRRRRVFVVGHLGDWRRAAAVLFDRESLSGNPPPRREAGQGTARGFECGPAGGGLTDLAPTLDARCKDGPIRNQVGAGVICANSGDAGYCLTASAQQSLDAETETLLAVSHALRGEGFDASEDGTGRGTPIVPVAIQERAVSENPENGPQGAGFRQDGASYTLEARNKVQAVAFAHQAGGKQTTLGATQDGTVQTLGTTQTPAVAFDTTQITSKANYSNPKAGDACHPLAAGAHAPAIASPWAVRRLMPIECERLQGFPDGYTATPNHRGTPAADGPRYKQLGNSWAINCVDWIAEVDTWTAAAMEGQAND